MGNEVSESQLKERERLPIFISYGHQSHEETVLKIKDALEVRGHKIWIDTEGIRDFIYEHGITGGSYTTSLGTLLLEG